MRKPLAIHSPNFFIVALAVMVGWLPNESSRAQVSSPAAAETETPDRLVSGQKGLADRFSRLEDLLLRSAELEAGENPTRAALLQQAVQLGKQAQLTELLAGAASKLEKKQYTEAIEQQKRGKENLKRLLELLQSENREKRVREQRDQVRRWIEETDRLLRLQSSLRGRTEGGQDAGQAAGDQSKLANKASDIIQELGGNPTQRDEPKPKDGQERANDQPSEGGSDKSDSPPGDESQPDAKDAEGEKADDPENGAEPPESQRGKNSGKSSKDAGEPSGDEPGESADDSQPQDDAPGEQGEPKAGQGKPGQSSESQPGQSQQGQSQQGQSQQGQSQQGQSQQGQPGESPQAQQPQDPTDRARQQIEQARQKMQEAQQALEKAQREEAVQNQREAEERLREAIERLEEILRQLREEEIERSLASLETRLRRMLDMQNKVLEETSRLLEIGAGEPNRQVEILASNLALEERKILHEGERAYLLLREEGSSAAFPEAIEQVNSDIADVADRLAAGEVDKLTLVIEEEIVSALEEMVEALVQVQKENQKKQQQRQGQPQQGQPGDQPLVDQLAELRLIRTLQVRINSRTDALSKMLADPADVVGQVEQADILAQLHGLAERQANIQQVTRDIVVGKGE